MEEHAEFGGNPGSKRQKAFHQNSLPALPYEHYTIAWISALHIEMAAARAMLDEVHESPPRKADDTNTYALGKIHDHNVVIACLPVHEYGTNNAAAVVTNMRRTFPGIEIGLMVGIGGGAPGKEDIRLGDIVVGTRVMQYDLGKIISDGKFHRSAFPRTHGHLVGTSVSSLRSRHELEPSRVPSILQERLARQNPEYSCPVAPDRLFNAAYEHENSIPTCDMCDQSKLMARSKRIPDGVRIHYGAIASGNQVMKHATTRDNVARELDVICFEMEAAGIMDILPCLPIRGICDYSDSHKNKEWQRYAAATAASYARELIEELPGIKSQMSTTFISDADQPSTLNHRDRLLDSLKFDQIDSRRLNIKRNHAKTCQWFLSHPDYKSWLDPTCLERTYGFLWVSGKPGSGKSTIMKFAHSKMKSKLTLKGSEKESVTASFFFNARGEYLEKSISGMYRSLLYQLLKGYPELQMALDDLEMLPQCQDDCPSLNLLKDLFHAAVTSLGQRSLTCFIDALDECDEQQVREIVDYFEDLAEECTDQSIPFRICFSSRHYPYISIRRGMRLTLEDQTGHAKDLEVYIASRLLVKDKALIEEIQPRLLTKAAGVFMWVVLVVDIMNKEYERGGLSLRKRLAEIPSDLSELFKDILRRDKDNMEVLLLCIRWLLLAKRPLKPQEFYHALWCDLAAKDLADDQSPDITSSEGTKIISIFVISSSKGLAEVTGSNPPTVQFIHESVRDFLIKDRGLFELWPELEAEWEGLGHEALSHCCHRYFTRFSTAVSDQDSEMIRQEGYPFLQYATQNVLFHANAAAKTVPQSEFLSLFPVESWRELHNMFEKFQVRRYRSAVTLLYILADQGFSNLVRTVMIQDDPQVRVPGERYRYPLFAALASGSKDTVAALLKVPSTIEDGVDIAERLDLRKDLKTYETRTPLTWAAQEGRLGMVKHLINLGADLDEVDRTERTALSRASENGHQTVAELLIDRGARVNDMDRATQWTPLMWASEMGHEGVAKLLIKKWAHVNACYMNDLVPITLASRKGHEAVVKLLILSGADHNVYSQGMTPLMLASQSGHETVARLLIDNKVHLDSRDKTGRTSLITASESGHKTVVKLLIDNGAKIEACDEKEWTPLLIASQRGHKAVVKLLLLKGADPNCCQRNGWTPLMYSSQGGHLETTRILVEKGADPNTCDKEGLTPLMLASQNGHEAVAKLLLDNRVQVDSRDSTGWTSLMKASKSGYETIVKLLIDNEPDIKACDGKEWTSLLLASQGGHEAVVNLLLLSGADPNGCQRNGWTPLMSSSQGGHFEITRILLEKGAHPMVCDELGQTPLMLASRGGHEAIAKLLVDYGADPVDRDASSISRDTVKPWKILTQNDAYFSSKH